MTTMRKIFSTKVSFEDYFHFILYYTHCMSFIVFCFVFWVDGGILNFIIVGVHFHIKKLFSAFDQDSSACGSRKFFFLPEVGLSENFVCRGAGGGGVIFSVILLSEFK